MTNVISFYGGYVLKYIGDAVLAFFVIEDTTSDEQYMNKMKNSGRGIRNQQWFLLPPIQQWDWLCLARLSRVIKEGINPILNQYDYPELKVRVGN